MEKNLKSRCDLDLDRTKPKGQTRPSYFPVLIMFKFQVDWLMIFLVIVHRERHTETHTGRHEYSIVAVNNSQL